MLIGLQGEIGAGKDTMAEYLQELHSFDKYAFADALKEVCAALYGLDVESFYSRELKEQLVPDWGMTRRQMAQQVGTELVRNNLGNYHWIQRLHYQIVNDASRVDAFNPVVITDVRFQNEIDYITARNGYICTIKREDNPFKAKDEVAAHASEQQKLFIPESNHVFVLNSGTKENFYTRIDSVITLIREAERQREENDIPF